MSQVNAITIVAENLQSANIATGNVVTFTVVANQVTVTTGNITANSTVLKLDNTTAPIFNTAINTTAISTSAIELNGVEYTTLAPSSPAQPLVDYQVFTNPIADNKWYKPSWAEANDVLTIMMWGGGGGKSSDRYGGGGGACVVVNKLAGECNAICNVVVGAGGISNSIANGTNGGNSYFWSNSSFSVVAYGGGGANTTAAGGGGGWFGVGSPTLGGGPIGGNTSILNSTFGGGGVQSGGTSDGGISVYGGGGGGAGVNYLGGKSIYGGGGGAARSPGHGVSIFGGNGASGSTQASAPGGGGGGELVDLDGARGEVRITTTKSAIGGSATPFYTLTANTTTLYEGNSALFTITTLNVENGTTLYYTLNNSSNAVASDFSTAVNGSIVINGGSNTFTLTANNDADTVIEPFQIDLRTGSSSGPIVASTNSSIYPVVGTLALVNTTSTSSTTINVPTGTQAGDILILAVSSSSTGGVPNITEPAGFTQLGKHSGTRVGTNLSYVTYSSGSSVTYTNTGAATTAILVALRPSGTATFTTANTTTTTTVPVLASGDFPGFFFTAAMSGDGTGTSTIGTPGNTTSLAFLDESQGINSAVRLSWIPDVQYSMPSVGTYTFSDNEYRTYSFLVQVAAS